MKIFDFWMKVVRISKTGYKMSTLQILQGPVSPKTTSNAELYPKCETVHKLSIYIRFRDLIRKISIFLIILAHCRNSVNSAISHKLYGLELIFLHTSQEINSNVESGYILSKCWKFMDSKWNIYFLPQFSSQMHSKITSYIKLPSLTTNFILSSCSTSATIIPQWSLQIDQ